MTLNRNPENFFAQVEQAAFSPGNTVPGIGLSPDKMLLGRAFAYNDAQRNRIGTIFHQLPVNRPKVPVNTYMFDGQMALDHAGNAPVYAPNSGGRSWADETGPVADAWETDGEMCAAPTACMLTTTISACPANSYATSGTTRSANSSSVRSPAAC
jgi:catalase